MLVPYFYTFWKKVVNFKTGLKSAVRLPLKNKKFFFWKILFFDAFIIYNSIITYQKRSPSKYFFTEICYFGDFILKKFFFCLLRCKIWNFLKILKIFKNFNFNKWRNENFFTMFRKSGYHKQPGLEPKFPYNDRLLLNNYK